MKLSKEQLDRAKGTVIASAIGDALGAGYEFDSPRSSSEPITFKMGFFRTDPGEWTDDTSMAIPILERISEGDNMSKSETLSKILRNWHVWYVDAPDVGTQTRSVLSSLDEPVTEESARICSRDNHKLSKKTAGNGSLMRIGPLALGFLEESSIPELLKVSERITRMTHWDRDNVDACILWSLAIRNAILTGEFEMREFVKFLPVTRRKRWSRIIDVAFDNEPSGFHFNNGWVVAAFQGALSSINRTQNIVETLEAAVRGGGDADTVAAIAGSFAGALYGAEQIPDEWKQKVFGYPGYTISDLETLVEKCFEE